MSSSETPNYLKLENYYGQIHNLNNILSIIYWDYSTFMPALAASSRQNEITEVSSIIHKMSNSKQVEELIFKAESEVAKLDEWQIANIREIKRNFAEATSVSEELQQAHTKATNECEFNWRKAKTDNDYNGLKPYLQKVFNLTKEIAAAKALHFGVSKYDALINIYQPDSDSKGIKSVYSVLKAQLPELIQKITEKQARQKVLPLKEKISISEQKAIGKKIMEIMGFNFQMGRLDESVHPFCGGTSSDIRMTTRYDEDNFISGLMGVIHETGHSLYEMNLPHKYKNQPVGKARGMAFHESQSLVMEMQAGRSREFMEFLAKLLKDEFSFKGNEYSAENLFNIMTAVKPSFIRVDADEVTYPLHVVLRFELEEALINGDLDVNNLPEHWNKKMHEYLGIKPSNYSEGCLQDIHWPSGAIGYFPSYTNGAIISSMLMSSALKNSPSIKQDLTQGNFTTINEFLNKNMRNFGSFKKPSELLFDATSYNEVQPEIFLKYLTTKYL